MLKIGLEITKNKEKFLLYKQFILESIKSCKAVKIINVSSKKNLKKEIKNIDVLLTYTIKSSIFDNQINNLKWIQIGNAGVDDSLFDEVINSNIIITNSRGINSIPVAEYVMATILYFSKNFSDCLNFKKVRKWSQWEIAKKNNVLKDQSIGIIGYGAIGKEIAKRAKAFNMKVFAIRRLQKKKTSNSKVDELLPINHLEYMIKKIQFLIISCPLTPLTRNLINKKKLNLMSENSYLINISRGDIVNEKDLIEHLKKNKIKGAALDVFHNEPLKQNNDLFKLENVFLSPHISGNFNGYHMALIDSFTDNLNRYLDNKPLKNRVCKKRLY